jgi:hypothetical protein
LQSESSHRVSDAESPALSSRLSSESVVTVAHFFQAEKRSGPVSRQRLPSWLVTGMPMYRSQRCRWSDELGPQCGADDRKRCHLNQFHTRIGIEPKFIITTSEKRGMSVGWSWLPPCLASSAFLRCVLHALPLWIESCPATLPVTFRLVFA